MPVQHHRTAESLHNTTTNRQVKEDHQAKQVHIKEGQEPAELGSREECGRNDAAGLAEQEKGVSKRSGNNAAAIQSKEAGWNSNGPRR